MKTARLTHEQFKKLVSQLVTEERSKLMNEESTIDDTVMNIVSAISHYLTEHMNSPEFMNDVQVMLNDTLNNDDVIIPGRYEDVDHYALKVVPRVCRNITDDINAVAVQLLSSLMEPV